MIFFESFETVVIEVGELELLCQLLMKSSKYYISIVCV